MQEDDNLSLSEYLQTVASALLLCAAFVCSMLLIGCFVLLLWQAFYWLAGVTFT